MKTIPTRAEVAAKDKWDLTSLFENDEAWENALSQIKPLTEKVAAYKGKLGENAETLLAALRAYEEADKTLESVYSYASLMFAVDMENAANQEKDGRVEMAITEMYSALSFFVPELQATSEKVLRDWIYADDFSDYRIYIEKLLYLKPYILSEKEERLMSLQSESGGTARSTFSMLTNSDFDFGTVEIDGKQMPLTQSTYSVFLDNPNRAVREKAYKQFYGVFENHKNTLATLYAGSVKQDLFSTRARGYGSCLERALYGDKVPVSVYKNLIDTVHKNFPALHKFYSLRKKILKLDELRHYDVYVPLVPEVKSRTTYEEGVEICREALKPLGTEYTDTLCGGLLGGWADRYENKGKRSGAFSSGGYKGYPYIMLNYKEDVIRDVFTMAHEGGHSMHSWYSIRANPYMQYQYTIFEAEVASTFNEELVFEYLLKKAETSGDQKMEAYLLAMRASDILATLHRQTMFAEFEMKTHELVENGTPLSCDVLRKTYRSLLEQYFGPEMKFEENSDMEGLRIPHFYSAFYVYKYATGISAALALANRVTKGGSQEREDYFKFLKSGGSRYPIEALRVAGVDMERTEPVQAALDTFAGIVEKLEQLKI